MAGEKRLPWANKIKTLIKEVGQDRASLRICQRTWKMAAVAERDRRKWQEVMGNKSTLEKYRRKEEKKFEEWLDREEGRTIFNIRAGSLGLRHRTGRTAQDKCCLTCTEGGMKMSSMWCLNVQLTE